MSKAARPLGGIAGEGGEEGGREREGGRKERREGRGEYEKTNREVFHKANMYREDLI